MPRKANSRPAQTPVEAAWADTRSRPFDPPTTGKIAVKVINHYGDEVLRVYEV